MIHTSGKDRETEDSIIDLFENVDDNMADSNKMFLKCKELNIKLINELNSINYGNSYIIKTKYEEYNEMENQLINSIHKINESIEIVHNMSDKTKLFNSESLKSRGEEFTNRILNNLIMLRKRIKSHRDGQHKFLFHLLNTIIKCNELLDNIENIKNILYTPELTISKRKYESDKIIKLYLDIRYGVMECEDLKLYNEDLTISFISNTGIVWEKFNNFINSIKNEKNNILIELLKK